jgi:antitoxin component of MazEF toxin-antitoxin module
MKKYTVTVPFSLLEKVLLIEGDEIYAELVRKMYHIYHPKTRRYIGKLSELVFPTVVKESETVKK